MFSLILLNKRSLRQFLIKLNMHFPYDLGIPFPAVWPQVGLPWLLLQITSDLVAEDNPELFRVSSIGSAQVSLDKSRGWQGCVSFWGF